MGILGGYFNKRISNAVSDDSKSKRETLPVVENEGLELGHVDPYRKFRERQLVRQESTSISTLNTILAIKDVKRRRIIVTKRINRLRFLLILLMVLSFIMAMPYPFLLYDLMTHSSEKTLGLGIVDHQVRGISNLEIHLSVLLFIIGCFRFVFPKKEPLYYLTQICYLFTVVHYIILMPLSAMTFYKNWTTLETRMERELQAGRCYDIDITPVVPTAPKAIGVVKDSVGCVTKTYTMSLASIRPATKTICDDDDSWFKKATTYERQPDLWKTRNEPEMRITYEAYSTLWLASQTKHKCCGIHSPKDWQKSLNPDYNTETELTKFVYPSSCCKNDTDRVCVDGPQLHRDSCAPKEKLTVVMYSVGLLVTMVVCCISHITVFILLIHYRRMIERFRPDLIER